MNNFIKFQIIAVALLININISEAQDMAQGPIEIIHKENFQSSKGDDSYFTGDVSVTTMLPSLHVSNISLAEVSFTKEARTAWHTHPHGQILVVTDGIGNVQKWGEEEKEIKKGDVVWFPANVKHWHGAASNSNMKHISIVVLEDGVSAQWQEKVSNEQYGK